MSDTENNVSVQADLKTAYQAGLKTAKPVLNKETGILVTHRHFNKENVSKEVHTGPKNPNATIAVHRPDSFPVVYEQYKEQRTKVFADAPNRKITAVFDFSSNTDKKQVLGWSQFKAEMQFELSRKLKEWQKMLDWTSQADFANFLEDHLEDVHEPNSQDLLSLATDLEASSEGHFKGKMNLDNGSYQLSYQDEVQTTVDVPKNILLVIPLFEHGDNYQLNCRLRFNVTAAGVRFKLLFTNLQDSLESHFEEIAQKLEDEIKAPVIRGSLSTSY